MTDDHLVSAVSGAAKLLAALAFALLIFIAAAVLLLCCARVSGGGPANSAPAPAPKTIILSPADGETVSGTVEVKGTCIFYMKQDGFFPCIAEGCIRMGNSGNAWFQ